MVGWPGPELIPRGSCWPRPTARVGRLPPVGSPARCRRRRPGRLRVSQRALSERRRGSATPTLVERSHRGPANRPRTAQGAV